MKSTLAAHWQNEVPYDEGGSHVESTVGILAHRVLCAYCSSQSSQETLKQYNSGQIVPLKDGTKLKVLTGFAEVEKLMGYDSLKSKATGTLVVITLEFSSSANPQLGFILSPDGNKSYIAMMVGERKIGAFGVAGPHEKPDRVQFAGYQYRTDDGRQGYSTFLSGTKYLLVFFDVPTELVKEKKSISLQLRVGDQLNSFLVNTDK